MTTLTASNSFPIGDGAIAVESVQLTVLPVAAPGQGPGRLVHPTLGTYDYPYPPDEWEGFEQDLIVPPVWANAKTLAGAANTLWPGHIRDLEVEERWTGAGGTAMPLHMLRMLVSFWTQPPDPASGFVQWWPSYVTTLGFKVAILEVGSGGRGVTLDYISKQGWVSGAVALRMRMIDRA